ncbi:MAG: diguanylate cyclase (GGDEF)-like protein/PAS domain S-box-containing protein [Cellvibrionaceae bacterium]|jgi:diguanylate cyclase (GGDEF)-like protein/PAS domain S-box-containing protein
MLFKKIIQRFGAYKAWLMATLTKAVPRQGFKDQTKPLSQVTLEHNQDTTPLSQFEESLRETETYLHVVLDSIGEPVFVKDAEFRFVLVNDAFCSIFGLTRSEIIGTTLAEKLPPSEVEHFFSIDRQVLSDGKEIICEVPLSPIGMQAKINLTRRNRFVDAKGNYFIVGIIHDITERKQLEREKNDANEENKKKAAELVITNKELVAYRSKLERNAHYDVLTNLPNRVLLADRLSQAMIQSQRRNRLLAIAFIDLDGFKVVNDTHGHNVGDQLIVALSKRMNEALREGDTLARIGGDEFIAVMVDLNRVEDCQPLLERLLEAAADFVTLGDTVLNISASIGVTFYPQDGAGAEQLMRHADQAMYVAKKAGKNRYHLFDVALDNAIKVQR